eukprot:1538936-Pyramimonas_sp.AAC.1
MVGCMGELLDTCSLMARCAEESTEVRPAVSSGSRHSDGWGGTVVGQHTSGSLVGVRHSVTGALVV